MRNRIPKQNQSKQCKTSLITSKPYDQQQLIHHSILHNSTSSFLSYISQISIFSAEYGQDNDNDIKRYSQIQFAYSFVLKYVNNLHLQVQNRNGNKKQGNKQQEQKFMQNLEQCILRIMKMFQSAKEQPIIFFHNYVISIFSFIYQIQQKIIPKKCQIQHQWLYYIIKIMQIMDNAFTNNIKYYGYNGEIVNQKYAYFINCGKICVMGLQFMNKLFQNRSSNVSQISEIQYQQMAKINEIGMHTVDILINNYSSRRSSNTCISQIILKLTTQLLKNKVQILLMLSTNVQSYQLEGVQLTQQQILQYNPTVHKQIQHLCSTFINHCQSPILCNKILILLSIIQPIKSALQPLLDKIWESVDQANSLKNNTQYEVITIIMCKYARVQQSYKEKQQKLASKWLNLFLRAVINDSIVHHDSSIGNNINNSSIPDAILNTFKTYSNAPISNTILSYLFSPVNSLSFESQTVYTSIFVNALIKQLLKLTFHTLTSLNNLNWQYAHTFTNYFFKLLVLLYENVNKQIQYVCQHYFSLLKLLQYQIVERVDFSSHDNIYQHIEQIQSRYLWILMLVHTGDQLHHISKHYDQTVLNLYISACNYLIRILQSNSDQKQRQSVPHWLLFQMLITLGVLAIDLCCLICQPQIYKDDEVQDKNGQTKTRNGWMNRIRNLQLIKNQVNKIVCFYQFLNIWCLNNSTLQPIINKCIKKILDNLLFLNQRFVNFIEGTLIIQILIQWITNCLLHTQKHLNVETAHLMHMLLLYAYYSNPSNQFYQLHFREFLTGQHLYLQVQRTHSSIAIKQLSRMLFAVSFTTQLTNILAKTKNSSINMGECIEQYQLQVFRYIQTNFNEDEYHKQNNAYLHLLIHVLAEISSPITSTHTDGNQMQEEDVQHKKNDDQLISIIEQLFVHLDRRCHHKWRSHNQHQLKESLQEPIDDDSKYRYILFQSDGYDDLLWKFVIDAVDNEVSEAITILCAYSLICKVWNFTTKYPQLNSKYFEKLLQINNKIKHYLTKSTRSKIEVDVSKTHKMDKIEEYLFISIKSPLISSISQIMIHLSQNISLFQNQSSLTTHNLLLQISQALNNKIYPLTQNGINYYQQMIKLKYIKQFHENIIKKIQEYCTTRAIPIENPHENMDVSIIKNNQDTHQIITINNRCRVIKNISKLINLS